MSYQKQNFANDEVLSASQLNHIEQGIVDVESAANATKTVVDKIIDPTLSLSGKAADAAKVGEAVGQLKEDLDTLGIEALSTEMYKKINVHMEIGSLDGAGTLISNTRRIRTSDWVQFDYPTIIFKKLHIWVDNWSVLCYSLIVPNTQRKEMTRNELFCSARQNGRSRVHTRAFGTGNRH